jgi:acyl carrier protein
LTIATELKDDKMEAAAKMQMAELHCEEGEYSEAEKFCKQAMETYQKAGDSKGEVFAMMTLIKIYMGMGGEDMKDKTFKPNMEKASKVATDAVGAAGKTGDKGLRAMATYYQAMALMCTDKMSESTKKASEAQSVFVSMGSDSGEARCLTLIAQNHLMNMNEDKAADVADRAMKLANKAGDLWTEYDAAMIVAVIAGRQQAMMASYQAMMPAGDMQFAMAPQGGGGGGDDAPQSVAAAAPKGLDPAFVRKQLMTFVKDVMATDDELELDSPFMEAGMDSLSSVSLMSMVAKEFQMALSPSLVFDFPTVRALEDHLVEESKNA